MSPKDALLCAAFAVVMPAGQVMFKWAAVYNEKLSGPPLQRLFANYPLMGAGAWYAMTALLWFYILTRVPLSQAYAFALVGACLVPLIGWLLFKEQVSWQMGLGYLLILAGLFLVVGRQPA